MKRHKILDKLLPVLPVCLLKYRYRYHLVDAVKTCGERPDLYFLFGSSIESSKSFEVINWMLPITMPSSGHMDDVSEASFKLTLIFKEGFEIDFGGIVAYAKFAAVIAKCC